MNAAVRVTQTGSDTADDVRCLRITLGTGQTSVGPTTQISPVPVWNLDDSVAGQVTFTRDAALGDGNTLQVVVNATPLALGATTTWTAQTFSNTGCDEDASSVSTSPTWTFDRVRASIAFTTSPEGGVVTVGERFSPVVTFSRGTEDVRELTVRVSYDPDEDYGICTGDNLLPAGELVEVEQPLPNFKVDEAGAFTVTAYLLEFCGDSLGGSVAKATLELTAVAGEEEEEEEEEKKEERRTGGAIVSAAESAPPVPTSIPAGEGAMPFRASAPILLLTGLVVLGAMLVRRRPDGAMH
jgi:hypothetical protein